MPRFRAPGRIRSWPIRPEGRRAARGRAVQARAGLIVVLAVVLAGCGQAPSSTVPSGAGQGPGGTAAASLGLDAASRGAVAVSQAELTAFETALINDVVGRSGILASLGAARWSEFEAFLRKAVADGAARKGLLGGWRLVASILAAPRLSAAGSGGAIGVMLAWSMMDPVISGKLGDGSSTSINETQERVDGQERSVGHVTGGITVSRAGSRVVADVDIGIQVDVFDATSGAPLRSTSFRSAGRLEVDFCPDAAGKIRGRGSLTVSGSNGGSTVTSTANAEITGTVGEDAYLQSIEAEIDASDQQAPAGGGSAQVTSVSSSSSITMGPRGGIDGQRITRDVGRLQRDTANASQATLDALVNREAMLMAMIVNSIGSAAQAQWRGGACVEIRSTEPGRDVRKNELVQFTASLFHKIEGVELHKPIFTSFAGKVSVDPVDIPVPAPVQLSYKAGSQENDRGTVHLKSTSNRGIAELDVSFRVKGGWKIDSTRNSNHLFGQKCGDPTGQWLLDGTYDRSGFHGVQHWAIAIDANGSTGTYTYTDDSTGSPVAGVTVYQQGRAGGTITLTFDSDGRAVMHLQETQHTYNAWTDGGGKGSDQNAPLISEDLVWETGAAC